MAPSYPMMKKLAALLLSLLASAAAVFAQPKEEKLRVATRLVRPFVFEEKGQLTGFSIELWQEISKQLNVKSEFVVKPSVRELLDATRSKEADLAIAAISITADREIDWDFSQPMFDAGLQILTPAEGTRTGIVAAIVTGVFSSAGLPILGLILLIILVPAHLVWFFERRNSTGLLTRPSYFPGIFEACWWAASTLATQADQMPRTALARIVAVIWMFASVVFIAYFTAAVTSSLTIQQLHGDINGPEDLPGNASPPCREAPPRNICEDTTLIQRNFRKWRMPFRRFSKAKPTPSSMMPRSCSTMPRTRAKAKFRPSAISFAKRATVSSFHPTAGIGSESTKRF
jgi:polar amino acid transport system substrate-binding protein